MGKWEVQLKERKIEKWGDGKGLNLICGQNNLCGLK